MIGAAGPVADAEVALLLIEALEAAGLASFTVGIGTTDAVRVLLEKAAQPHEWSDAVLGAVQEGNLVELDRLTRAVDLDVPLGDALREVPRLRGGREAIERADRLAIAAGCVNTVCNVRQACITIDALGLAHRASVDFGIMRSFGYYTGLQLEASAPGLGLPLAGGGRYNRLLGGYGQAQAAAGFAIGLERVMIALAEQGTTPVLAPLDAVIGGMDPLETFAAARRLRDAGWRVRVAPGRTGSWVVRSADHAGAVEALLARDGDIFRLDRAGEPLAGLGDRLPEPPAAGVGKGGAA
jgi:ATP phosphoribosyltransferase regulatory subunit HisZ